MDNIDQTWVEAGAKALVAGKTYGGWIHDEDAWRAATGIAEKVITAVEPLIRADERKRIAQKIAALPFDLTHDDQVIRGRITFTRAMAYARVLYEIEDDISGGTT